MIQALWWRPCHFLQLTRSEAPGGDGIDYVIDRIIQVVIKLRFHPAATQGEQQIVIEFPASDVLGRDAAIWVLL